MMFLRFMSCATLGLSGLLRAEDPLPKPALLPTTKAIHELIAKQPDPAADAMKPLSEKVPKSGETSFDLVPIPGGEFTIGSPEGEAKRLSLIHI